MVQDLVVVVDGLIAKFASWQLDPFESTITAIEEQFIYTLLRQIKMKMRKQRPGPILMQRHSETCSQHYTIEFEVRQIPSSEIIERDRFLHVFWNVD